MSMIYEFDPHESETLRVEAQALIGRLREHTELLEHGTLKFEQLQETYRTELQPKASGLVRAMLQHVPDDDPRLMRLLRVGTFRDRLLKEIFPGRKKVPKTH